MDYQQFAFGDIVRLKNAEDAPEKEERNLFVVQKAFSCLCRIAGPRYSYLTPAMNLELVPKSPWIASKERLPEAEKPVAIFVVSEEQDYCDIDAIDPQTNDWINYPTTPAEYAVTHWMPLPRSLLEQANLEAAAAIFKNHFEEMVAAGRAERMPDGRYKILESGE